MTTPLRRQYLEIKRRYPHAILFFRLGDFYETFDEDAETVARELEITLTSRPMSKGERVPLAGIPYHALDSYLAKLIAKGYKVAICEQMARPGATGELRRAGFQEARGPAGRARGDAGDAGGGEPSASSANNYLAALRPGAMACAAWPTSTFRRGSSCVCETAAGRRRHEVLRVAPAELLLPQGSAPPEGVHGDADAAGAGGVRRRRRRSRRCSATSLRHRWTAWGWAGGRWPACAAGAILAYLEENQRAVLGHMSRLSCRTAGGYMNIDQNTARNLELFAPLQRRGGSSLLRVLDETKTAMGARLLRQWLGQPLLDITAIARRQDSVAAVLRFGRAPRAERRAAGEDTRTSSGSIADIDGGGGRAGAEPPRDLAALGGAWR